MERGICHDRMCSLLPLSLQSYGKPSPKVAISGFRCCQIEARCCHFGWQGSQLGRAIGNPQTRVKYSVFEGVFYISLSEYRITGKTRASALSSVELGHQSTSWRKSERMRNLGRGDYNGEDTARENRGRTPLDPRSPRGYRHRGSVG